MKKRKVYKHLMKLTALTMVTSLVFQPMGNIVLANENIISVSNETQPQFTKEGPVHMTYMYGNRTTENLIKMVDKTDGAVNVVTPEFFRLTNSGRLIIDVDEEFVAEMHNRGIRVTPYISNNWSKSIGRIALRNKERITAQIAAAIEQYNLDGIDVDIENLNENDKQDLADFMRLLRWQIPSHKSVSLAVAPNPYNWNTGWQGSYDYPELIKYVDYFMLMTYDEATTGSPEGPVASLPFVEKSIINMIEQGVDPQQIVLGIPFYGRYWKYGDSRGGNAVSNQQIEDFVHKHNGTIGVDPLQKQANARVQVSYTDRLGNFTLTPGRYSFWFDNDDSFIYKFRLVQKYNLRGIGSWNLDLSDADSWQFYKQWGYGDHYFLDTVDHPYEKEILNASFRGWIGNLDSYYFYPNDVLVREDVINILKKVFDTYKLDENTEGKVAFSKYELNLRQLISTYIDIMYANYLYSDEEYMAYNFNISKTEVIDILKTRFIGIELPELEDKNSNITKGEMALLLNAVIEYMETDNATENNHLQ